MPPIRRSGRQRQSTTKYGTTVLDKEALRQLWASSELSHSSSLNSSAVEEAKSDHDFDTNRPEDQEEVSEEDDSILSEDAENVSDGSEIQSPDESQASIASAELGSLRTKHDSKRKTKSLEDEHADEHVRGGLYPNKGAAREYHWMALAGPDEEDLVALVIARDRWASKRDATFPSRKTVARVAAEGIYGITGRFGVSEKDLRRESTEGWEWYEDQVGQRFRDRQHLWEMGEGQSDRYLSQTTGPTLKTVLGPTDEQQDYEIQAKTALDFGKAFERHPTAQNNGEAEASSSRPSSRYREGWLLNLQARIRCLAWAPNRQYENVQYLAVSTACSKSQRETGPDAQFQDKAPAFYPSPDYPSSIEIWAFESQKKDGLQKLNMAIQPKLVRVFCTDWGEIKQLEWCPILREGLNEDGNEKRHLGLLGILCGDGHVRVLDVALPPHGQQTSYMHVKGAAFDAEPSPSIFTCFSFASSVDILCGSAQGTVELFNILPSDNNDEPSTPYLSFQQSLNYLLNICSIQPSPFPHLLASLSMSAVPVLTDLRAPSTDRVSGKSIRVGNKCLAYSPHLRTVLTASTEGDDLLAFPIRRFFMTTRLGRIGGQGSITALATSRWHPCALFGTSGGAVCASNVLRGLIPTLKKVGGKGQDCMVQKLCEYQWIPTKDAMPAPSSQDMEASVDQPSGGSGPFHIPDARSGTSRFYESFKAERQNFALNPPASRRPQTKPPKATYKGASQHYGAATVYPEEQAVTALQWNPNIACAGWIAVGWGSGILRVDDVAHDQA